MNKEFWDKVNRLEILAQQATQGNWFVTCDEDALETVIHCVANDRYETEIASLFGNSLDMDNNANYIAAANPAMIQEMIAELRSLSRQVMWCSIS